MLKCFTLTERGVSALKKFLVSMMSFLLSMMIFVFAIILMPAPEGFVILEYHNITDTPDPEALKYNVRPDDFAAQLDYLADNGYTTITMLDYIEARNGRRELPSKPIMLTFDDGYENNYTTMLPMLEARGMRAVVYVIANELGRERYLTFDQLRDMQTRGIEIGSHTANHRPLDELDQDELNVELRDAKTYLEWSGINTIYSLSYPNGIFNDEIISLLERENYYTAVTGEAGLNNFGTDQYRMHRVNVPQPTFGLFEFRLRLLKAELFAKLRSM